MVNAATRKTSREISTNKLKELKIVEPDQPLGFK
jgi:hypothetical protein